jgi:HAE1 family hydrophobic/amphiphilic exporter-1
LKLFIERPVATAMFFLAVLVLGVYSFLNTPLELAPKEEFPQVNIQASWPGVSPEIIQSQVTAPLEELSSTVKGVRKITSQSQLGMSLITLEIDPKANMEFVNLALREVLAKARPTLPYGVRPVVQPYVPEDLRVQPFLRYTISGDYSLQKLRELVKEKLEFGIGSINNIAKVEVTGGADPEIRIVLDKKKLKDLEIQPYQVNYALSQSLRTFPAGRMKKGNQEFIFRMSDEIQGLRDLGELIIAYSGSVPVRLSDVARVVPSYGDILYINRINGQPTVMLTVLKDKGSNSLKVAREVKKKLELIKKELPQDLIFKMVDDESEQILKNLRQLYLLAGIITAVVFVLIFIVLRRLGPSLLILSSIAFSVVITFNLIYLFKISLNMLTLGALALGFGMFVDDSIVVFENILRLREKGLSPVQAAIQGSREVFVPVLASTLTVVSVFFCFPYFQGRLKLYFLPLAFAMSAALTASLLVSFSLIPALSPALLKPRKTEQKEKLRGLFERILGFLIRHPVEVLVIVLAMLYGSYKWFRKEVTLGEFFRWSSEERLRVGIEMPPGTEIEKTDDVVKKFEQRVLEADYEKEMNTNVYAEGANIVISFPPKIERSYRPYALKERLIQLATQFAGISVYIYGFDPQGYYSSMGTGTYYDSRIKFFGYNLKKLKDITSELELRLKRNPRIKDVKTISSRYGWWWGQESFEYVLKVDPESLKRYNIDPLYLYYHIQTLLRGRFGAPLKLFVNGRETELRIKFPEAAEMDLKQLQDALLRTQAGEYLRFGEISKLEERPIAGSIDRENQQFQQTVMWEFRGPTKAAENYRKAVFASLSLPPGFSATMEETWRITEEEKTQLKFAIMFSLLIIFMILAALYESLIQPFFIMLAVPLDLIGVFIAFIIAGYPFDASAYIGVIILGGIVVKNAILIVDHINLKRKQGLPLVEAVLRGARERVRPIFMTTSTTVFGILPLLLIKVETGRRQIWSVLALCTAGGLVSSTIFVLIVIPILYFYGDKLRPWVVEKFREVAEASKKLRQTH